MVPVLLNKDGFHEDSPDPFLNSVFRDSFYLLFQFVELQLAVAIGIQIFEPLGQGGDVPSLGIANVFLQRDRSVTIPIPTLEKLFLRAAVRRGRLRSCLIDWP